MKLQFTNNYRPRFDQISRILQFILTQEGRKKISQKEIVDSLGIPKNQVENLISMMIGFGLVQPKVGLLTVFGKAVVLKDPYFEKIETLWMIHYYVSSNPEWVVWYRIVNKVIPGLDRYSAQQISTQFFKDLATEFSEKTISDKLPTEVGAVFASYTRTELSRLNIIEEEKTGHFLRANPVDIPVLAFLFCLISFRDRYFAGSTALNTEDICLTENSPGRVLNLPEYQVRQFLDDLHREGLIRLEKFANLDQVRLSDSLTEQMVLSKLYGE